MQYPPTHKEEDVNEGTGGLTLAQQQEIAPLESEQVIIEAPMSFVGSYKRLVAFSKRYRYEEQWKNVCVALAAATAIFTAWSCVAMWYLFFGLLVVPYRMIRRGQRRRTQLELQHREQLEAMRGAHLN